MKKVKPIFLLLFLKQELKKIIRNVQNKFYTHYHGCYGNIFFSKVFVKNKIFQIKPIIFKAGYLKLEEMFKGQRKMSD